MELSEIGEFGFIRRVSRGCLIRSEGVERAIGDDAAAFHVPSDELTLVTTDLLVERVHFLRDATSAFNLGHKAMAVNLSDIAAMGGTPREAFVSTAIPAGCPVEYLDEMYDGMKRLAAQHGVNILGGDTTASAADLVLNVTVIGHVRRDQVLYRSGARPGDAVCVTGPVGDSRAGLHFVLQGTQGLDPSMRRLFEAHILPRPHLEEGRFLAATGAATAALDVSDGLSSDLTHIVEESGVGIRVEAEGIPISAELREFCARLAKDPVRFALSGGEDYVLAVTVRRERVQDVSRDFAARFGRPLYRIGEATDSGRLELVTPDGRVDAVGPTGWDHFGAHDA
ncbi:MAG: thiamine-phosphate kinase [Zetaproteobacteria bacterium]|nr:MAG: thiamine-phosphate kinase [Zetaproteobacteria bacterium]